MAGNTTSLIIQAVDKASGIFKQIGGNSQQMGKQTAQSMDDSTKSLLKAQTAAIGLKDTVAGCIGSFKGLAANAGMVGIGATIINTAKNWALVVDDVADATGATAAEASKLLVIGKSVGFSTDEAAGAFAKFGKAISGAKDSMSTANAQGKTSNDIFSRLGLTINDLQGKNSYEVFQQITEKLRGMTDGADKTRVEMELFGRSGYKMHDMLNMSAEKVEEVTKKAEAMGLILDDETTKAWENMDREMNAALGTASKLAISIGNDMLPALQAKVGALKEMTDAYGNLSPEMRHMIGLTVEGTGELGLLLIGARTVAAFMPYFSAALLSPWTAVIAAIGIAIYKLKEYMLNAGGKRIQSYNPDAEVIEKDGKLFKRAWIEDKEVLTDDLGNEYNKGGWGLKEFSPEETEAHYAWKTPTKTNDPPIQTALASPAGAADKAENEIARMTKRLSEMVDGINERIIGETGTTMMANTARMTKEINKMYTDLQEMAEKGIDVSGATDKINDLKTVMEEKFKRDQLFSRQETENQIGQISANNDNDKRSAADAKKEAAYISADKESLDVYKKTGSQETADALLKAKKEAADKAYLEAIRDINLQEINMRIQHNGMLIQLEGKTQTEIDELQRQELQAKINTLDAEIIKAGENKDEVIKLEQEKVNAIQQLQQISSRNISTAGAEAIRQIKEKYTDYSSIIVGTYDEINRSVEDNWVKMLSFEQGFATSTKNIFNALTTDILNMFAKIAYQQTVVKPLNDWFTGIVGSWVGGGQVGIGTRPEGTQGHEFANGGFYKKRAKGGMTQGMTLVGEEGPELANFTDPAMIYTAGQTKNIMSGGAPQEAKVTVNITNNSDTKVKASQRATFDSETQTTIVSIVIDAIDRNVGGMRDAVFGGAG